jgi:hypothetical protein
LAAGESQMILQGLNKLKSMPAYSDLINDLMNQSLDISSKRGQKAFVVLTKLIEMQSKFRQFQPLDNSQTIA